MDRLHDTGGIFVQRQSTVYSKLLHEGEFVKGKTQRRLGKAFWPQQNIHKAERIIFLVGYASRCQKFC
jgi:hypothetical protein